jgi:hypothetical protein
LFVSASDGGVNPTGPIALDPVVSQKVVVEVALYEPGGAAACPADAPMVALGRSSIVDLKGGDADIIIPLGCHPSCETRHALRLELRNLEDNSTGSMLPSGMVLGEIYSYEPMISVAGTCGSPTLAFPRGQFRSFSAQQTTDGFAGDFAFDPTWSAGCVAARIAAPDGVGATYACLESSSLTSATLWKVGDDAHLATLLGIAGDSPNGALVVRIYDRSGNAPVGARLSWWGAATPGDAEYLQEDWTSLGRGGLTSTGIAIVLNAPTGIYEVTYPTDENGMTSKTYFTAGGADEPRTITTISVFEP